MGLLTFAWIPIGFSSTSVYESKMEFGSRSFLSQNDTHTEGTDVALFILTIKWETASRVSNDVATLIPNCATRKKNAKVLGILERKVIKIDLCTIYTNECYSLVTFFK